MNKSILKQCTIVIVLFLSGCMSMNGKFDCNVGSGGRCAPMSHINKMASQGAFNESAMVSKENALSKAENKITKNSINTFNTPIRSSESIQQIWIAPYEDNSGNYHEGSYLHTVVKKGKWVGDPVSAITE
jgi:type IV conjugative transfer system lipoprotein TraV